MSAERPESPRVPTNDAMTATKRGAASDDARQPATVIVRGEAVTNQESKAQPNDAKAKSPPKPVSEIKVKMQSRLPALDDDVDVGVQKTQVVVRDGEADLAFPGTLIASAGPPSAPNGQWQEYRIYETAAGKYVFSKIGRNVSADEQDTHEAEIFDPAPSSVPTKLLRSARDITHTRPLTWSDAAVEFFGYDPLAKTLYRKISGEFEEHLS